MMRVIKLIGCITEKTGQSMRLKAKKKTPVSALRALRVPIALDNAVLQVCQQQKRSYSAVLVSAIQLYVSQLPK